MNPDIADQEILRAFATTESPCATAHDLADVLALSPDEMANRLADMADKGQICRKPIPNGPTVYYPCD